MQEVSSARAPRLHTRRFAQALAPIHQFWETSPACGDEFEQVVTSPTTEMVRFKAAAPDDVAQAKERAKILLVTATNVETTALHAQLRPLKASGRCLRLTVGNQTYYISELP